MASKGRELTSLVPDEDDEDYKHVKSKEVQKALKIIFEKASHHDHQESLKEVRGRFIFFVHWEWLLSMQYSLPSFLPFLHQILAIDLFARVHESEIAPPFDVRIVLLWIQSHDMHLLCSVNSQRRRTFF